MQTPLAIRARVIWEPIPWKTVVKVGMLDLWTSFFQGDTGDLVLLLVKARGKRQEKCTHSTRPWEDPPQSARRCMLIRSCTSRQQFIMCAVQAIPGKECEMGVFACSPFLSHGGHSQQRMLVSPLITTSLFVIVLRSHEPKACWLLELCDLGAPRWSGSLQG